MRSSGENSSVRSLHKIFLFLEVDKGGAAVVYFMMMKNAGLTSFAQQSRAASYQPTKGIYKMKRKNALPELLSPAGDFECLIAAVEAGADAVYIGGKSFSARAFAKNFDIDEIRRAVSYCHLNGVKLYVTMNTLTLDTEAEEALRQARELYLAGVDALIIADIGLISLIREYIPQLELHASTQMSVHNSLGADKAAELGCSRCVLARELSGADIASVTKKCIPETEVFLHGALCVCHSGQCLFSSLIGGRSGNRGECAQPCRLPYNDGKYILSLNDLSLSGHIRELIDSGVASLKIEGRMKSPDYVYTVTSIYRALLDAERNATRREDEILARAFSRSGFTDGYFLGDTFRKMTGIRTEAQKEEARAQEKGSYEIKRVPVRAEVSIRLGEPARMTIISDELGRESSVTGAVPEEARNQPLTEEGVRARLSKMGNTLLSLSPEDIKLELEPGVILTVSALNELRRACAAKFEGAEKCAEGLCEIPDRLPKAATRVKKNGRIRTALFFDKSALVSALSSVAGRFDAVFLPLLGFDGSLVNGVYLPPVIMEHELPDVRARLRQAKEEGCKYALVGNLSHIELAREFSLIPIGDFRLNITNSRAYGVFYDMGVEYSVLSAELTAQQAERIGGGAILYGRIPLMITERCFMKETFGCDKCSECQLIDRKGVKFPMIREYMHRNIILNSVPTYMGDRLTELRGLSLSHLIFTTENAGEIARVLDSFEKALPFPLSSGFRRMGKRS